MAKNQIPASFLGCPGFRFALNSESDSRGPGCWPVLQSRRGPFPGTGRKPESAYTLLHPCTPPESYPCKSTTYVLFSGDVSRFALHPAPTPRQDWGARGCKTGVQDLPGGKIRFPLCFQGFLSFWGERVQEGVGTFFKTSKTADRLVFKLAFPWATLTPPGQNENARRSRAGLVARMEWQHVASHGGRISQTAAP